MKKYVLAIALGLVLAALLGCPPPSGHKPGGGIISGNVTDAISGEPISGVTVMFGGYTATTDATGACSIDVDSSVNSVEGLFAAYKDLEYTFRVCDGIAVDPTTNPIFDFELSRVDTIGYSQVNLSGRIMTTQGPKYPTGLSLGSDSTTQTAASGRSTYRTIP